MPFYIVTVLAIALLIAAAVAYKYYLRVFQPNVMVNDLQENAWLYVPTASSYDDLVRILDEQQFLDDVESFKWVAEKMNLKANVYPGRFQLKKDMNNYDLVSLLRSNQNVPLQLTINHVYSLGDLAGLVGNTLELDSAELAETLVDEAFLDTMNYTKENILTHFIPNTYEFYWNTGPGEFIQRMDREYDHFWNEARLKKAQEIYLDPTEVTILASIVQEETAQLEEMPTIAGVYLNRLNNRRLLQADPTVKYAVGDRGLKRILNKHKEVDSPYNTYKYKGLPPGPIVLPQINAIDAVLNAEDHNYFYFCAKADMSGYHHFSTNFEQHKVYARQYRRALNKLNIR